ncbi:MAG TPA: SRPBCC domain-containing protein [Tessaracoccus flavescens]|uniref:SRPBCC domain-containing protein n=1 Tax=Tessaracoccus flavescens TaxID=399497 RepID=A0A921JQE8_9ACTN|nr:SRPBCC domain-containing protein [Tessaracoccus flavescens]
MDTVTEETVDSKSVKVTRVVAKPLREVWDELMRPNGAEPLLGEGGALGSKGDNWESADGSYGVTRSFHPMEQVRFSWHESEGAPRTLVEVDFKEVDEGTQIDLIHDFLPEGADRDALSARWQKALDAF